MSAHLQDHLPRSWSGIRVDRKRFANCCRIHKIGSKSGLEIWARIFRTGLFVRRISHPVARGGDLPWRGGGAAACEAPSDAVGTVHRAGGRAGTPPRGEPMLPCEAPVFGEQNGHPANKTREDGTLFCKAFSCDPSGNFSQICLAAPRRVGGACREVFLKVGQECKKSRHLRV